MTESLQVVQYLVAPYAGGSSVIAGQSGYADLMGSAVRVHEDVGIYGVQLGDASS